MADQVKKEEVKKETAKKPAAKKYSKVVSLINYKLFLL